MLDKHTHSLIAQRLNQAEKQREQIRAIRWITRRSPSKTPTRYSANG